jgi:hypothetical protein
MKRHSITSIAYKAQRLSLYAKHHGLSNKFYTKIIVAQVAEIIRLHAEDTSDLEASNSHLKGLAANMEAGSNSLFEAVKVICEDYNSKILKP